MGDKIINNPSEYRPFLGLLTELSSRVQVTCYSLHYTDHIIILSLIYFVTKESHCHTPSSQDTYYLRLISNKKLYFIHYLIYFKRENDTMIIQLKTVFSFIKYPLYEIPVTYIFQGLIGQARLGKMSVDYTSIWEEVSDTGFKGAMASSEYDRTSIVRLQERIQVAVQLLRSNDGLDRVQRRRVKTKLQQMMTKLAREQVLAKRVDTSIP